MTQPINSIHRLVGDAAKYPHYHVKEVFIGKPLPCSEDLDFYPTKEAAMLKVLELQRKRNNVDYKANVYGLVIHFIPTNPTTDDYSIYLTLCNPDYCLALDIISGHRKLSGELLKKNIKPDRQYGEGGRNYPLWQPPWTSVEDQKSKKDTRTLPLALPAAKPEPIDILLVEKSVAT